MQRPAQKAELVWRYGRKVPGFFCGTFCPALLQCYVPTSSYSGRFSGSADILVRKLLASGKKHADKAFRAPLVEVWPRQVSALKKPVPFMSFAVEASVLEKATLEIHSAMAINQIARHGTSA